MACCILIAKGYSSQEAVDLVKRQRAVAKPEDAHILARISFGWEGSLSSRLTRFTFPFLKALISRIPSRISIPIFLSDIFNFLSNLL
jgi:hypothetical protein